MNQLTSQKLLNYSVSLYLRKPVYYIRLKSQNLIYSLSLRTKHKKTALSKLLMVKQELELEQLTSKFNSFQELQRHFKSAVELDTNIKSVHFINQTPSIELPSHSQAIISINELCNNYIQEKESNWKYATQLSSQANKSLLIEIFDYLKLDDITKITRKDMLEVREVIKRLPVNRKQIFKEQSLKEALAQYYNKTLSTRTINGHLIFLSSVFNWAEKNDLIKKNLATDLFLKDNQKEVDKRNAFSIKQIELILSSCKAHYARNGLAWQYFISLLSAITGARLNEICQLQVKDVIKTDNNIIYLDINAYGIEGKSLKNQYSARTIPLVNHAFGFDCNEFMDYISSRKHQDNLLFDVTWTDKRRYSDKVSKWFNRTLLKQTLNSANGLSFHSFRHSLATLLKNSGIPLSTAQQILGHSSNSLAYDTYGKAIHIETLHHSLEKALIECRKKD